MTNVAALETPYIASVTANHIHRYSVNGKRPADVMAAATRDLTACITESGEQLPSNPADLISAGADPENGGMYFEWSEETDNDSQPWESEADDIRTVFIHAYTIQNNGSTADAVRATMDAAEKDAFAYAEANDLEYSSSILGVSFANESFTVLWSTETD